MTTDNTTGGTPVSYQQTPLLPYCDLCNCYGHHNWDCWKNKAWPTTTVTFPIYTNGWQCLECKTVYSPDVDKCECSVELTEAEFEPYTIGFDDDIGPNGMATVTDNYTENLYVVNAETIIQLLRDIHGA